MKMLLVWAVAAWMVAVTAERPCAEYCVYLSSGIRDMAFQAECDCLYEETRFQAKLDESSIYYEPADYIPLPAYNNRPFYIVNPIIQSSQEYVISNSPLIPENVQPYSISRQYNRGIEFIPEAAHFTHNRKEKDIKSNNYQTGKTPLYLDIDVETGNPERSASTNKFTAEELQLTEQRLSECIDLYDTLNTRKGNENNGIKIQTKHQSNEQCQHPNEELTKIINDKCLHIAYIVEKSLKEIKKTRGKVASNTFEINAEGLQQNYGPYSNDPHDTNRRTPCMDNKENNIQLPRDNEYRMKENSANQEHDSENQESTVTIYAKPGETVHNKHTTLSSEELLTTTTSSFVDIQSSTDNYDILKKLQPDVTAIHIENEYPLHIENITLRATTMSPESSETTNSILTSTNTAITGFLGTRSSDQEFKETNDEGRSESRSRYKEGEVPLPKIVTNEFKNNTLQSFINGTEDIPNGDFKDESKTLDSKENNETSEIYGDTENTSVTSVDSDTHSYITEMNNSMVSDVSGNLYFILNDQQVPVRFIQNQNGSLHLGIDGIAICNELAQSGAYKSILMTTLCNCYKSGNCTHKGGN